MFLEESLALQLHCSASTALQFSAMEGQIVQNNAVDWTRSSTTWRGGFSEGFSAGFERGLEQGLRFGRQQGHPTTSNPSSSDENNLFQFWGSQGWESYGKVHQQALRDAWVWWSNHGASVEEAAAVCKTLTDGHVNFKVQLGCLAEYHARHLDVVGWQDLPGGGDKRWVRLTGFDGANDIWSEMAEFGMTKHCQPCKADNKPVPINAVEGLLSFDNVPSALPAQRSSTQAT